MTRNALLGLILAAFVAALALAYGFYGNTLLGLKKDPPELEFDQNGPRN